MIDSTLMPQGDDSQETEIISEKAIVSIKMSTGYYKRIQALLSNIIEGKSPEDIKKMHDAIVNKNIKDAQTYHYETLLILCKEFEYNAKDQGFVEKVTIGELKKMISSDSL
jgi:hypothetical protein